ncbi:hypothetical protein WKW50_26105, partial [Ochrobactrum sp. GPK 3]
GDTLSVEGQGDISAAAGVTNNGVIDIKNGNTVDSQAANRRLAAIQGTDIEMGHLRGGENAILENGAQNIIITNGDGSEYKGLIGPGTGGFTVEKGKQVLSGDNTYTGNTYIADGA